MVDKITFLCTDANGEPEGVATFPVNQKVNVLLTTCCMKRGSQCECPDGPQYPAGIMSGRMIRQREGTGNDPV
jgi:hypothetical protein